MADKGVKITTIDPVSVADDVIVLREGSAVRQSVTNLANQLAGSGPISTRLSRAEAMSGVRFDSLEALRADPFLTFTEGTASSISEGDIIQIGTSNTAFVVAASGATDYDEITAGGIPVYEAGPMFSSRERAAAAVVRGMPAGFEFYADNIRYVADSSATRLESAMSDIGVDGVIAPDMPDNAYIFAGHDQSEPTRKLRLFVSSNLSEMHQINSIALNYGIIGYTPSLCYRDGWWYLINSVYVVGTQDFIIFKSRDLITWDRYDCTLGPSAISNATTPLPGGTNPPDFVWGVEGYFDANGDFYIYASVRYGADPTDDYGNTVKHFRTYVSKCNDLNALTFDAPTAIDPDGDTQSLIDPYVMWNGYNYYLAIKDEISKKIRLYYGSTPTGPWSFANEVTDPDFKIEGPCITPRRYLDGGIKRTTFDMLVDAHNDVSGNRSILPLRYSTGSLFSGGWSSAKRVATSHPVRHGTAINLAFIDPKALGSVKNAVAVYGAAPVKGGTVEVALTDGAQSIYPQQDCVYYVAGTGVVAEVTLLDGPADRFYFAALSEQENTGILVREAGESPRQTVIGFGLNSDQIVEYKRRGTTGKYYAVGKQPSSRLSVHKGGSPQEITTDAPTVVTWPAVDVDIGEHFDTATGRWTPPRGNWRINASILFFGGITGETNALQVRINGTVVKQDQHETVSSSGSQSLKIAADLYFDGTDYMDVVVDFNGAGTKTVTGATTNTWLEAMSL